MSLFKRKPRQPALRYDPQTQQPAVRRSICTGEMTAGFIDRRTGKFTDLMLLNGLRDLEQFKKDVGTEDIKEIY